METYEQSDAGYPEEVPPEVAQDSGSGDHESAPEKAAKPDEAARRAPDNDDGNATGGNP